MFDFWDKSITVYIRKEIEKTVQWERQCFSRCFFKHILSSEFDEKSRINGESYVVRVPCAYNSVPDIPRGSIVVRGVASDELSENASGNELLKKYGADAFKVGTVSDNRSSALSHIRIGN